MPNDNKLVTLEDLAEAYTALYNRDVVTAATQQANGLMSSTDKGKLDGIETGAQVNPGDATTSASGLMSSTDKTKLDGIAAGAQVNPDIVNDLIHTDTDKPLSANQGKVLNEAIEKREVLIKELSIQASNLPQTFTNQTGVETDMVCIKAEFETPSAQLSDWEVNTNTAEQIVISGSKAANVATTLKLYLMKSR